MPIGEIGQEFLVNTTTSGNQTQASISELADGRFVVAWTSTDTGDGSSDCIRARVYGPDGVPQGNDFLIDTTGAGAQQLPSVAALSDGRFVVTWQSADTGDGSAACIRAILCDADGTLVGTDFIVDSTTLSNQFAPAVSVLADGGFAVTWRSTDSSPASIRARVFDADGNDLGNDFVVATTSLVSSPAIAGLADGGFVVAWQTDDTSGADPDQGIRARLFDRSGTALGTDFVVNSTTTNTQLAPFVTALADGHFIVTWQSDDTADGDPPCIRARIFDSAGIPIANDFQVNTTGTGDQRAPAIAALADGHFVVVWQSTDTGDGSGNCLRARVFNADGSSDTPDFIVNTAVTGDQFLGSVTAFADGRFAVAWTSNDPIDGSGQCVRAQIFDPTIFNGTSAADIWHGGELADHITGGANGDHLEGLGGDDFISGDAGLDVLVGGNGNDHLFGGDSLDTISGDAGNDFLFGDEGDDTLFGNDGNDVIQGGEGVDLLNGGAGDDTMAGGAGADSYFVDSANDVVDEAPGEGGDTVNARVSYALKSGSAVETLQASLDSGTAPINLTGNELVNTLQGNAGNNLLNGGGAADVMRGQGGDDTYVVDDSNDVVDEGIGSGVDIVRSSVTFSLADAVHAIGSVENLTLTGSANIDGTGNGLVNVMTGNAGRNALVGAGNRDTLNGKASNDTLTGGPGNDFFVFDTALNASTNVDHITDFSVAADTIRLENAIFHGLTAGTLAAAAFFKGAAAHDGNDRIIYNPANGFVIFDANGSAAGGATHFATLAAHLALTIADFVVI